MAILIRNKNKIDDFQKEDAILKCIEPKFIQKIMEGFIKVNKDTLTFNTDYQNVYYNTMELDLSSIYEEGIKKVEFEGSKNLELINNSVNKCPIDYVNNMEYHR